MCIHILSSNSGHSKVNHTFYLVRHFDTNRTFVTDNLALLHDPTDEDIFQLPEMSPVQFYQLFGA